MPFTAIVKNKKPNTAGKTPNYTNHNAAEEARASSVAFLI